MGTPVVTLKLADLATNGNVRRDLRLDDGFIQSIETHGILQPILVTKGGNGIWTIVAGHRRAAAAKQLGHEFVPVSEVDLDNPLVATQVVENLHRNDLTPLELAQASWDLKVEGLKQSEVATQLGMTKGTVSKLQKIGKAAASDELMDDERLDEMNQLSIEGLLDLIEYTPEDVNISDVIRIYGEESQSIRSAVQSAKHEASVAVFYVEIAEDMHTWNEAGIQTVASDPSVSKTEKDQWGNAKKDNKYRQLGAGSLDIDLDEHMKLPCHVIQVDDGNARYGYSNVPRVIHWCSDFKIHAHKGKSEVKEDNAETIADRKKSTLDDSRAIRAAKVIRRQQANIYLSQREAKAKTLDMALELAIDTMHWDDKKLAIQILELDGDRPVPTDSSWYANKWNIYLAETFGKDYITDEKARLYVLRMIIAIKHWQDRGWQSRPMVKVALADLDTIEVPTDG